MVVLNYYNYKHSHFTDHRRNYECLYADTGTNCRVNNGGGGEGGEGGVWSKSKISTWIEDNKIGIPPSKRFPDSER